jgi:hypothetical protein
MNWKECGAVKSKSEFKKATILLIAVIGLSMVGIGSKVLADNIKRSCKAHYFGWVNRIESSQGSLNIPMQTISFAFSDKEFSAQGGCGKLVPNRCRKRARDKLLACAKAHVKSPNQAPGECRSNDVTRYPIQNLTSMIKEKACGPLTSKDGIRVTAILKRPYQVKVTLGVFVSGDDDCGYRKPGTTVVDGQKFSIEGNQLFLSEPLKNFTFTCQ